MSASAAHSPLERVTSALLALAILCSAAIAGVVVVPATLDRNATPTIGTDVCHPLQGLDRAPELAQLAHPAAQSVEPLMLGLARVIEFTEPALEELVFSPTPPPPKSAA